VDHGNKVAKVSWSDRGYCAHGGFAVSALRLRGVSLGGFAVSAFRGVSLGFWFSTVPISAKTWCVSR
jgi:hypothetical protein